MSSELQVLVLLPAIAALVAALIPKSARGKAVYPLAIAVSVVEAVLAIVLAVQFKPGVAGYQGVSSYNWIPTFGISWRLGVDGISIFLVVLTAIIFPLALLGARERVNGHSFAAWMLLLEAACMGSFASLDLFAFFVTFELTLIPTYFLIGSWGYERSGAAAIKFFVYTFLGSALLLVGMLALVFIHDSQTGVMTFNISQLAHTRLSSTTEDWLFLAFTAAFAVKAPIFPFHTWSPDAYRQAPTAGVVVLAAIMAKLGTYGILRFDFTLFPRAVVTFGPLLLTLAVIGIIYGGVVAAAESDIKRMLAYSSLSHMGFIVLGIFGLSRAGVAGGVLQMINHGVYTAALFLLVGYLFYSTHAFDMDSLGGLQSRAPVLAGIFTLFVMSSIGLPGLSGFVGEFLILVGGFSTHRWWAVVGTSGVVIGAIYMLWAYQRVFHGTPKEPGLIPEERAVDLKRSQILVLVPLIVIVIALGVYPRPILSRISPTVDALVAHVQAAQPGPSAAAHTQAGRG
ncbi:MAG: NADH-quinone oxidoreductase subunit M [Nitrospiraceae bacterium]|nr:NADH-quinone oxidoreductase subunit M [Nitrospiraceae bacterium]